MSTLVCTSCETQIPTAERTEHYGSEWHRYNVKRKCAGLAHIPKDLFNQKLDALKTMKDGENAAKATLKCTICNKSFSGAAYQQHLSSKRHLTRAGNKKEKQTDSTTPDTVPVPEEKLIKHSSKSHHKSVQESKVSSNQMQDDGEDDEDDGKDDPDKNDIDDDAEFDEAAIIPNSTCFFCNKDCKTTKKSLNHMLKKHGFFIPFIEYLKNLEKFIEYFGAKLGVGRICLYCNKAFDSLESVQKHMKATSHCKIRMQGDDYDDEEVMEFYRFPKKDHSWEDGVSDDEDEGDEKKKADDDDDDMQESVPLPPKRRHLKGMNEAGELIMTDGAIIGHRSLKQVYNLNVRPTTKREEIIAMMGDYKALKLEGYDGNRRSKFNQLTWKYQQRRHAEVLTHQYRSNNMKYFVDQTES